jgi:hypothetical protein
MYLSCRLTILFAILLVSLPDLAISAFLTSGQLFNLTTVQGALLKQEPGIDILPCQTQGISKDSTEPQFSAKHYQAARDESLYSDQKNMTADLNAVDASQKTKAKANVVNEPSNLTQMKDKKSGIETEFILSMGYRVDDIDWNIAGNTLLGNYVNVLSELTWNDIEIYQLEFRNKTILRNAFYLRGSLGYGWILGGDNQDSDYLGNNRTLEYSRSNSSTDDNNVWDASLGLGYQFRFRSGKLGITPLIGYSYHQQNLTMTNGNQTVASIYTSPVGPIEGLDSTYNADWNGPWIGLDINYKFDKKHTIYAEVEYHRADYYAEANWNLRADLNHPKSFEHTADGNGIVISMGGSTSFKKQWTLNINFDYQKWSTDTGTDRVFFSSGTTLETPLNEVNWQSYAVMMGVAYHF